MLQLDYKSGMSICDQIINGFIRLISLGVLRTGDSLPSVRQLASQLSVNPNTIQKAYAILEERGVIYSVKGKGSFVADDNDVKKAVFLKNSENLERAIADAVKVGFPKESLLEIVEKAYREGEREND